MEVQKFIHRNLGFKVQAVQVKVGTQNEIAKWCKGTAKGRASKRVVILSKDDGQREVAIGSWVIKIGKSYVTLTDTVFWIIFVTEAKYKVMKEEAKRLANKSR